MKGQPRSVSKTFGYAKMPFRNREGISVCRKTPFFNRLVYSTRLKSSGFPGGGCCKESNSPHMSLNLTDLREYPSFDTFVHASITRLCYAFCIADFNTRAFLTRCTGCWEGRQNLGFHEGAILMYATEDGDARFNARRHF